MKKTGDSPKKVLAKMKKIDDSPKKVFAKI